MNGLRRIISLELFCIAAGSMKPLKFSGRTQELSDQMQVEAVLILPQLLFDYLWNSTNLLMFPL